MSMHKYLENKGIAIINKLQKEEVLMLNGAQDYTNAAIKKVTGDNRIDPGTFSLGQSGWWLLHAGAITGIYMLGSMIAHRD